MEEQKRLVHTSKDFRVYESETVRDKSGKLVRIHVCEELVGGRWEPFVSLGRAPAEKDHA